MNESQAGGAVTVYDFRRPVRMSRTLRARLDAVHERLARPLAEALGERLGTGCQATYSGAAEVASEQLFSTAFDPVYALTPVDGSNQILVRIATPLAQACIDRLLGGLGEAREVEREPTEIEAALLVLVVQQLRDALQKEVEVQMPSGAVQFLGAALRHSTEVVPGVAASFTMRMSEAEGVLQVFYSFEGIVEKLVASAESDAPTAAELAQPMKLDWNAVAPVRVDVHARLHPTSIQIRDLAALRVGDVVHLDQPIDQEIDILIGGQRAFRGHPGRVEDALGVQITRGV